jgi:pyrimidine-nucleoside phosphorylase
VGDKTSFLVAPLAAACGVAVPMISGRALGHTGGTLDKLEAIPGYRTALTLSEFETVMAKCGASIVGQTPALVPADRVLYALRDRTGTVENPRADLRVDLSKKLAAGLDALVLDVKTGSGAFLRKMEDAEFLAALMVATAEAAGTRTVALLTDMGQPLGRAAGNWIELVECVELLRGERPAWSEDLRELSLILAGWMIHLGGKRQSPEAGYARAEAALDGRLRAGCLFKMVDAQGGDVSRLRRSGGVPQAGRDASVEAWESGYVAEMDTTALGWAVQRTGAGREKAGEPVDPHAGILFHARRGARVEKAASPRHHLRHQRGDAGRAGGDSQSRRFTSQNPPDAVPLVSRIFTAKMRRSICAML